MKNCVLVLFIEKKSCMFNNLGVILSQTQMGYERLTAYYSIFLTKPEHLSKNDTYLTIFNAMQIHTNYHPTTFCGEYQSAWLS